MSYSNSGPNMKWIISVQSDPITNTTPPNNSYHLIPLTMTASLPNTSPLTEQTLLQSIAPINHPIADFSQPLYIYLSPLVRAQVTALNTQTPLFIQTPLYDYPSFNVVNSGQNLSLLLPQTQFHAISYGEATSVNSTHMQTGTGVDMNLDDLEEFSEVQRSSAFRNTLMYTDFRHKISSSWLESVPVKALYSN